MNTTSESRAERVLVWDLPVRIFHWLLVASFAGAWLTAESESWRLVHVTLGYTVAALVAFRIIWGFLGTRYARFSSFVKGPSAAFGYLKALIAGRPQHHVGHNPAGAIAIIALLALAAVVTATGYATYNDLGGEWLEEFHEAAATGMLAIVFIHVAGVLVGSLAARENLVRAMITGRKRAAPGEGIGSPRRGAALLLVAALAGVWWAQWDHPAPANAQRAGQLHQDDD